MPARKSVNKPKWSISFVIDSKINESSNPKSLTRTSWIKTTLPWITRTTFVRTAN